MKIEVPKCVGCGGAFKFDTDDYVTTLLQDRESVLTYCPQCPNCGRENEVQIRWSDLDGEE
ncbi:MAG TPA: hypothetical protein VMX94_02285 [Armatimonadota bacterium]|nr:hypothetical protein [Armatimonadota bacterium]